MRDEFSTNILRQIIRRHMNGKRLSHTIEVEREIIRLGEIFLPDRLTELRAAALLHDITKNLTFEEHMEIYDKHGAAPSESCIRAHKLLHAQTAVLLIKELYPMYDLPDIISAISNHTSGKAGMSVFDSLLFLADYIEESRTFSDCILLRNFFWDKLSECITDEARIAHLNATMAYGLDMTIKNLIDEGRYIAPETVEARNWFISLP